MEHEIQLAELPCASALHRAVHAIGDQLGLDVAWLYGRRYHFVVRDEWTIALSPETAGRIRVETCRWTRPVVARWVLAHDDARLAAVVRELAEGGAVVGA